MMLTDLADEMLIKIFEQLPTHELIKLAPLHYRFQPCIKIVLHQSIIIYHDSYHQEKNKVDKLILEVPRFRCTIIRQSKFFEFITSSVSKPLSVKFLRFLDCKIDNTVLEVIKEIFCNSEVFFNLNKHEYHLSEFPNIVGVEVNMKTQNVTSLKLRPTSCRYFQIPRGFEFDTREFPAALKSSRFFHDNITRIDLKDRQGSIMEVKVIDFSNFCHLRVLTVERVNNFILKLPEVDMIEELTISEGCFIPKTLTSVKYLTLTAKNGRELGLGFLEQDQLISFHLIAESKHLPKFFCKLRNQRNSLKQFLLNMNTVERTLEKSSFRPGAKKRKEIVTAEFKNFLDKSFKVKSLAS